MPSVAIDTDKRAEIIRRLRLYGEPLRAIGDLFGISRQRVDQILQRKKHRARNMTVKAVADGALERPDACEHCGREADLEAHHEDYNRPLDVTFLCEGCHTAIHGNGQSIAGRYIQQMKDATPGSLAERIRERRLELRMSQADLAEAMGIKAPSISYWETEVTDPRAESIMRIAGALCCSTDWLLFGHETPAKDPLSTDDAA